MVDPKTHRGEKYLKLLDNKDVKRWFENVARGSKITADVYLRRLGYFCTEYKVTPSQLVKMKDKVRYSLFMDMVTDLESKGKAGSYVHSIIKALKSWLSYHDPLLAMKLKIKIKNSKDTPTLQNERTPTIDELRKIILSSTKITRVACAMMAFSGIRPQVLGNYLGNDGLTLGDLPDLVIEGESVKFQKIPAMITVRKELSKGGNNYFTFIGDEGCEYILDYLNDRVRDGEVLDKSSPLMNPRKAKKTFITTSKIREGIRNSIRDAGFNWRPYVLRAYFDTQLMLAESKGFILRDYRAFWMGHAGDIEHRYTINKGKLSPQVIEDIREAYGRAQNLLQTKTPAGPNEEQVKSMFHKELLKVVGYTDEDIIKMDAGNLSDEKVQEAIKQRLVTTKSNHTQKIVTLEEAEKLMQEGWEYVVLLPNQKIVLRAPS